MSVNIEKVKKEAEEIMQKFAAKLEKISFKEKFVERVESMRDEGKEKLDFGRKIFFENSPKKKGDFIEAEKGDWT